MSLPTRILTPHLNAWSVSPEVRRMYLDHWSGWCLHKKLEVWGTKKGCTLHQKLGWFVEDDFFYGLGSHGIHHHHSPPFGRICVTFSQHRTKQIQDYTCHIEQIKRCSFRTILRNLLFEYLLIPTWLVIYLDKKASGDFYMFLPPPNQPSPRTN